jgi:hypothetical protein
MGFAVCTNRSGYNKDGLILPPRVVVEIDDNLINIAKSLRNVYIVEISENIFKKTEVKKVKILENDSK